MNRLLDKLGAILRRDFLTSLRYRTGLLFGWIAILPEVIGFYFLAHAIGPGYRPDGFQYFPFLLIGSAVFGYSVVATNQFLATIHEAQASGGLELLAISSTPALTTLTLNALSCFAVQVLSVAAYIATGSLVFRVPLPHANYAAALLIVVLSLVLSLAIALLAAAAQVKVQRGTWILTLGGSFIALLTGTIFPVSALPHWLQSISLLVPFTHALNGVRSALLSGASFRALATPIAVLAAYAAVLLPGSMALLAWALRDARRKGTLSFY